MNISNKGLDYLKSKESFMPFPYDDKTGKPVPAGQKPQGKLTIGYGHLMTKAEIQTIKEVTLDQANTLLKKDVYSAERAVSRAFPHLPQHQFDALVIFVFNIGETQFVKSSVYKNLKLGLIDTAIKYWKQYIYVLNEQAKEFEPCQGLVNRRNAEIDMFMGKI